MSTKKMTGYLIPTGFPVEPQFVEANTSEGDLDFFYRTLSAEVVEMISGADNAFTLITDEEALLTGKTERNRVAEAFLLALNGKRRPVYGDALFVGGTDTEGDTLPLSIDQFEALLIEVAAFTGK